MARRLPSTATWLRWLTPGLQIKRWLLLLMVSELVLVLGVAYALKEVYKTTTLPSGFYYITLQFLPYWARAFLFLLFGDVSEIVARHEFSLTRLFRAPGTSRLSAAVQRPKLPA